MLGYVEVFDFWFLISDVMQTDASSYVLLPGILVTHRFYLCKKSPFFVFQKRITIIRWTLSFFFVTRLKVFSESSFQKKEL